MKNTKKVLLGGVAALALVGTSVFGTYMYLTSKTDTVTNTFTVGKVAITLDEADTDEYGAQLYKDGDKLVTNQTETVADRVQENEYKLIPGHEYLKDPTVHVSSESEDSWLFVKVENGISDIEADKTIAAQMAEKGWSLVGNETNVYAYKDKVAKNQDIKVFESFTLTENASVNNYANAEITITSYAVQADGFDTAAAAWASAPTTWN
ncbi:MAG: hypothetical protein SO205_05845 [Bulleidia sp.]|nr:hypothetical protein [Bulleidia sp.]